MNRLLHQTVRRGKMSDQIVVAKPLDAAIMESVLLGGDLSKLSAEQRVSYYRGVCESVGLNPLTKPFDYMTLNGKLTLYAKKDATDQLRNLNKVSIDDIDIVENETQFLVKVKGHDSTGRTDVEIGVVAKKDMQGNLGNVQMKAVTKAKRRLTLSLCGLGWLDETEVETIRDARLANVKTETGEIVDSTATDIENLNQDTGQSEQPIELINPLGDWAVKYAAGEWNVSDSDAAKAIGSKKLGSKIDKNEFVLIVKG
jgi:hypothetical protein